MKKKLFVIFSFVLLSSLIFIACSTDDQDGLTVGFSNQNGTGGNPDNTSAGTTTSGSTTSTSIGSTSTTTSGSTTSTTSTGNWFKENSVLYDNCSVIGTPYNGMWGIIGYLNNDTCVVSFASIPNAGTYTAIPGISMQPNECHVTAGNGTTYYLAFSGTVTVSIVSATKRRVVFNLANCVNTTNSMPATLAADMTTP